MEKRLYIFLIGSLFLLQNQRLYSQNNETDKLTDRIFSQKSGTARHELFLNLVDSLGKADLDKMTFYLATECEKRALLLKDSVILASAYSTLGNLYVAISNFSKAIIQYNKAMKILENLKDCQSRIKGYSNLATSYFYHEDYGKMLDYDLLALKEANKLKDGPEKSDILCGLYNSLGTYNCVQKNYDSGRVYFDRSFEIAIKIRDSSMISYYYNNLGYMFKELHSLDTSLHYFLLAQKIKEVGGRNFEIEAGYLNLGLIHLDRKEYDQALKYANKVYRILDTNRYNTEQLVTYELLKNIYAAKKDLKNELKFYKLWKAASDSSLLKNEKSAIVEQELQYEFDKIHLTDSIRSAREIYQRDIELKQKKKESYFLLFVLIFAAIGIGFIYNRFKVTKKQKAVIESQKVLVDVKNKEIIESINYAKRLQEGILPSEKEISELFSESFVYYKPKDIIAGDFYWLEKKGSEILVAAADCTGHGVPGAMMSVACNNALRTAVSEFNLTEPGKVLDKVRELIIENFSKSESTIQDGMDISLLCVNHEKKTIHWSGANNRLLYHLKDTLIEIKPDKQPIGASDKKNPFTTHQIEYNSGMIFYLFTDGILDQFGGDKGKKYGISEFKKLLQNNYHKPLSDQCKEIDSMFLDWKKNTEQVDDVTILALKI